MSDDTEELSLEDLAALDGAQAPGATVRESLENVVTDAAAREQQQTQSETVAAQQAQQQQPEPIEAPKHWSKEDRETFAKQPREAQEWLLGRHKAMEGDNTRVSQELAELKKWTDPLNQVIAPYQPLMKQHNITPAQVLQNYINAERALTQNPVQALLQLAQRFQVRPEDLVAAAFGNGQEAQQQQVDPTIKALQDEIAGLKGYLGQQQQARAQQETQSLQSQIKQFAESAGQDGAKLYPHMENPQVKQMMSMLIGSGQVDIAKAGGVGPALKQAYEQAVYAIPETRDALMKSALEAQTKQAAEAQAKKVANAKRAGASVSGASALSTSPAAKGSIRATLDAAAREAGLIN